MQQPSAASSIGAQFLANAAPAASQDEANATPQTGQPSATPAPAQAAPAPSPEQQQAAAQNAHHLSIGRMFANLSKGSGTSASNFWRTVVGGAFAGIGAADSAPVTARGPYGDVKDTSMGGAASRGFPRLPRRHGLAAGTAGPAEQAGPATEGRTAA